MSEPASISTGIAGRYATAVFDLAREAGQIAAIEADVDALDAVLAESAELRDLINSPAFSRDDQGKAMAAIGSHMGLTDTMKNTLALLAQNRRLFTLPHLIAALRAKIADEKGEVTAEVTSAQALSKTQAEALAKTLAEKIGKIVKIKATVDESLIGGLVVKVGSTMIDTSIKSKLAALQNTMKEVG